jgi:hypothetical protein
MPEPVGVQVVEALRHVRRTAQLSTMGHEQQPGPLGDGEGRPEGMGVAASFVVREPEADHPAPGVLTGETRERTGIQWVPGAVRRDHYPQADAGSFGRVAGRVEHEVGELRDAAELRGISGRVDLDLGPDAAVCGIVLGGLADQPTDVVLGAQHRPGDVVEPLEPEPSLLVGGHQLRWPVLDERRRQPQSVALGQLQQRGVPHRAGEVQVQVRLRQVGDRPQRPAASVAASRTAEATFLWTSGWNTLGTM